MTIHHPPFVVNEAYARSSGLRDPSMLWTLMAPDVWVMERRISDEDFNLIAQTAILTRDDGVKIEGSNLIYFYNPVYQSGTVANTDILDYGRTGAGPVAWWLRIDLVPASERIRFPALATKINMKEALDLGYMRELYSWDGTGFKLRDEAWGRG